MILPNHDGPLWNQGSYSHQILLRTHHLLYHNTYIAKVFSTKQWAEVVAGQANLLSHRGNILQSVTFLLFENEQQYMLNLYTLHIIITIYSIYYNLQHIYKYATS